jgi:hypothetical protein
VGGGSPAAPSFSAVLASGTLSPNPQLSPLSPPPAFSRGAPPPPCPERCAGRRPGRRGPHDRDEGPQRAIGEIVLSPGQVRRGDADSLRGGSQQPAKQSTSGVHEVDFSDNEGRTYASAALRTEHLQLLTPRTCAVSLGASPASPTRVLCGADVVRFAPAITVLQSRRPRGGRALRKGPSPRPARSRGRSLSIHSLTVLWVCCRSYPSVDRADSGLEHAARRRVARLSSRKSAIAVLVCGYKSGVMEAP